MIGLNLCQFFCSYRFKFMYILFKSTNVQAITAMIITYRLGKENTTITDYI